MGRQRTPNLLGREDALRQLDAALDRVSTPHGALALVSGEAGIGKTRLLEEFAARHPDALVARGGCVEDVPYAPWTELLWWLLDSAGADLVADLPSGATGQLSRLIPSLAIAETEPAADDGGQQFLFEAVIELLRRAASARPLVVVVDDMHWIDPASRDLLRHVAGNLRRLPLLLVAAYRPEDSVDGRDLIAHLGRLGDDRITLTRLPEDVAAEIAAFLLGADAARTEVDRIVRDSGGNPLFVEELVAAADTTGFPETLRDLMLARFSTLGEDARQIVRIAAVIGARAPRAWLVGASGLSAERSRAATRAAVDAGVLVADDGGYTFKHELLRQAVLDDLLPDEEVDLHRTIASALSEHPEYAVGVDRVAELARHWDAAEEPAPALRWLIAAAQHANENYAFEASFQSYERALFWWDAVADAAEVAGIDHAALVLDAADAAGLAGHAQRGSDLARVGLDESFALDINRAVDAAGRVYPLMWNAERSDAWFQFAKDKLLPLLDAADPTARARFLVVRTGCMVSYARPAELREPAREMMAAVEGITDPAVRVRAHFVNAWCYESYGELERVDDEYERAVAIAREANAHSMLALALLNYASFKTSVPQLDECIRLINELDELIKAYGLRRPLVGACYVRFLAEIWLGNIAAAEAALLPIDKLFLEGFDAWQRAAGRAGTHLARGEYAASIAALDPVRVASEPLSGTEFAVEIAARRAEAFAWQSDVTEARKAVDEGRSFVERNSDATWHGWLAIAAMRVEADAAVAAMTHGDLAGFETAQARARSIADEWSEAVAELARVAPLVDALSAAVCAEKSRLDGERVVEASRLAAEAFEALSIPYTAVYFRWREAEAMIVDGQRHPATEVLKRSRAVALVHGFAGLDAAITTTARMHQLRLGPARTTVDGDDALSERELEVLRLMVDGRSNPEIAQELYISRRTAAAHVSNVLRKMGASSRVEAVTEAHRRGVV